MTLNSSLPLDESTFKVTWNCQRLPVLRHITLRFLILRNCEREYLVNNKFLCIQIAYNIAIGAKRVKLATDPE